MPVRDNNIYPNAPLELAAFELRIAHSLALAERGTQAQVYERLRERLPVILPQGGLQVAIGGPMMAPQQPLRLLDRERGESVVIGPETIVVESTSYRCYADFCGLLKEALAAVAEQGLAGFTRIGLRYINEVRRPGAGEPRDWEGLVHPALLAGASLAKQGMNTQRVTGEIEFATGSKHSVVMRYGSFTGRVVAVDGPLRTRTSETGPAFLIDLDSYWEEPAGQRLPEFSIDAVMETTRQLREPIHELFELAITDELRQTFREEQPS